MANRITRYIPNTLTCLNLFSGCVASVMAFRADYRAALCFILLSAVFDFLDGMAARLLHAPSPIGKDLDSLSDDISFGLAPSLVVFSLSKEMIYPAGWAGVACIFPYAAFLIAVFSALRLAKFNNDARQTSSFIGLPVPANALFWASFVYGARGFLTGGRFHPVYLLVLILLSSWLLVSEIPMFSLKFKNLSWQKNWKSYIFLIVCVPIIVLLRLGSFAPIIVWYILLSLATCRRKPAP